MGELPPTMQVNMMRITVACLLLSAVIASASEANPEIDASLVENFAAENIVPETELVETDETDALESAFLQAQDLVQTKGKNACKQLATSSQKTIKTAIEAAHSALKAGSRGNKCEVVGAIAVSTAKSATNKANEALKSVKKALLKTKSTKITWTFTLDQIKAPTCDKFYGSKEYKKALSNNNKANDKVKKAQGAADAAKTQLATAKAAQVRGMEYCYCDAKADFQNEVIAMNKKLVKANTDAWNQAAHILCVLDGTSMKSCNANMPAVPVLDSKLPKKLASAKCFSQCTFNKNPNSSTYKNVERPGGLMFANGKHSPGSLGMGFSGDGCKWQCQNTKVSGGGGYTYEGRAYFILNLRPDLDGKGDKSLTKASQFAACKKKGMMPGCTVNDLGQQARGECLYIGAFISTNSANKFGAEKLFPQKLEIPRPGRGYGWMNHHYASLCGYPAPDGSVIMCDSYMSSQGTKPAANVGGWQGKNIGMMCVAPVYGSNNPMESNNK